MSIHLDLHDWQENYAQVKIIHQIMQDALLEDVEASVWERKCMCEWVSLVLVVRKMKSGWALDFLSRFILLSLICRVEPTRQARWGEWWRLNN